MEFLRAIAHNIRVQGHATWLCARDPELGWFPRLFALAIAAYALSPIDLIPDFIPVLGYLDDLILVPLGIMLVIHLIPPEIMAEHRALAAAAAERPVGRTAAVIIVLIWLAVIGIIIWLAVRHR